VGGSGVEVLTARRMRFAGWGSVVLGCEISVLDLHERKREFRSCTDGNGRDGGQFNASDE
jgi:hypothetical protein